MPTEMCCKRKCDPAQALSACLFITWLTLLHQWVCRSICSYISVAMVLRAADPLLPKYPNTPLLRPFSRSFPFTPFPPSFLVTTILQSITSTRLPSSHCQSSKEATSEAAHIQWKCILVLYKYVLYFNIFSNVIYSCDDTSWIISITRSFRNHSNMLIWS